MERHTHCIARGAGYLFTLSILIKVQGHVEVIKGYHEQRMRFGLCNSFTFYTEHAVNAKCIHVRYSDSQPSRVPLQPLIIP